MMRRWICGVFAVVGSLALAGEPVRVDPSRGELLYTMHCVACHTEQVHWREKKLVTDWPGLLAEVRRWQGMAALRWSEGDVEEVGRYLNALHYRLPDR